MELLADKLRPKYLNEILKEFNKNELEFYLDSLSNKHKKEYLKSIN